MGVQVSLADRVAAKVAQRKPVTTSFFSRLPADAQEELLEVRRRWQAGEIPGSAAGLADVLIEEAAASGWQLCGRQGMRLWLAKKN
jgi:hypothetical protein